MEKKEVKKWQDEEALKRYQMIAPLLEADMDEGKRQQLREEAAQKNGISKRTLYRYEKSYREEGFDGLRPASRTKKRQQRLPENFEEIMEQAVQLKREVPKSKCAADHKGAGAGRMGSAWGLKAVHGAEAPV